MVSSLRILTPNTTSEERSPAAPEAVSASPDHSDGGSEAAVIVLNDAAVVFTVLADGIRGTAVDWSPSALRRLRQELLNRYGDVLGGEQAVEQLMTLACAPAAA